jgi:hypothetical protein
VRRAGRPASRRLESAHVQLGAGEALAIEEQVTADRIRILGPEHPDTLTARANLAASYRQAGRAGEAVTLLEQVTADRIRILGPEHPDTLTAAQALRQWEGS